jgi:hypothetical protein
VLIAGGTGTDTAELYDPAHGTFSATAGNMTEPRSSHTATLLGSPDGTQNGYVLVVGTDGIADLYDPSTQTFTRVGSFETGSSGGLPFRQPVFAHTASLRNDGTVLAAGGYQNRLCSFTNHNAGPVSGTASALFAPESDGFTPTGSLNTPRDSHTATVLQNGAVLVVGGTQHSLLHFGRPCLHRAVVLSSAELFQ